jgi:hypothetical protein
MGRVCAAGAAAIDLGGGKLKSLSNKPIERWNAKDGFVPVAAEISGISNQTLVEDRRVHKMIVAIRLAGGVRRDVGNQGIRTAFLSKTPLKSRSAIVSTIGAVFTQDPVGEF